MAGNKYRDTAGQTALENFLGGMKNLQDSAQANNRLQLEADMPAIQEKSAEKLKQFLSTLQEGEQKKRMQQVQDFIDQNAQKGRKVSASSSETGFSATQNEPNMYLQLLGKQSGEGKQLASLADKSLKPYKDQFEAADTTLGLLNQKNPFTDKQALANEAKMVAAGTGGRGVAFLMQHLGWDPSIGSEGAKFDNWFMNTAKPQMTDTQRDAFREAVLGRLPDLQRQYGTAKSAFLNQASAVAPMTGQQNGPLFTAPIDETVQRVTKASQDYYNQKAADANAAKSGMPGGATYDQPKTTVDLMKTKFTNGLKSFFGGGQAPAPQQNPGGFDPDKYLGK